MEAEENSSNEEFLLDVFRVTDFHVQGPKDDEVFFELQGRHGVRYAEKDPDFEEYLKNNECPGNNFDVDFVLAKVNCCKGDQDAPVRFGVKPQTVKEMVALNGQGWYRVVGTKGDFEKVFKSSRQARDKVKGKLNEEDNDLFEPIHSKIGLKGDVDVSLRYPKKSYRCEAYEFRIAKCISDERLKLWVVHFWSDSKLRDNGDKKKKKKKKASSIDTTYQSVVPSKKSVMRCVERLWNLLMVIN